MTKTYDIDRRLNVIRAWMHYNGITPHRIATAMGLSPGALREVFTPEWNPKTSTLRAIEPFMEDYKAAAIAEALARPPKNRAALPPSGEPRRAGRPETRRS